VEESSPTQFLKSGLRHFAVESSGCPPNFECQCLSPLNPGTSTDRLIVVTYVELTRAGALRDSEGALSGG
jgi:hypothetical protein